MFRLSGIHLQVIDRIGDQESRIAGIVLIKYRRCVRVSVEIEQLESVQRIFQSVPCICDFIRICEYVLDKPVFTLIPFLSAPQLSIHIYRYFFTGIGVCLTRTEQYMITEIIFDFIPVYRLFP